MIRLLRAFTGFMFGIAIAIFAGLAMLPRAHGAEPDVPQLVMVVGYQDGKPIGGQVLGFADSLAGCERGLQQMIPELKAKPGVTLVMICTPLPPAPTAIEHHQGETSI